MKKIQAGEKKTPPRKAPAGEEPTKGMGQATHVGSQTTAKGPPRVHVGPPRGLENSKKGKTKKRGRILIPFHTTRTKSLT